MPTAPRRISESGLYHVVARGNGRQLIFTDDGDREAFLERLEHAVRENELTVIAWCLMDNHVHLVVQDDSQRFAPVIGSLLGAYAKHFNRKTGHVGSVFQQRFFSEPIEDDEYLLASVRYVHINPEKAGICPAPEYRWSSYRAYATGDGDGLCATGLVLDLLDGPKGFVELCDGVSVKDVGFEGAIKVADDEAIKIDELKEKLIALNSTIFLIGDGAQLCYNKFVNEIPSVRLAPFNVRSQHASGICAAAALKPQDEWLTADKLIPSYLRLPQAQRELMAKKALEKKA